MFGEIYNNKKVLVTGHTGFKGSWLTTWLLQLGAEVCGYSIDIPSHPSHFEELGLDKRINHNFGDIRDYQNLFNVCNLFKPDFIFHLAAQPLVRESYSNPKETFEVNVLGTLNVLEVIRQLKGVIKAGVIITSDKCYNNVEWVYGYRETDILGGDDPYSGSKGAAELVAKSYMASFFNEGFPHIGTVRAGNVIGGGDWAKDRIVPDITRSWISQNQVKIRNPYSTRPWQHVLEPLSGYLTYGAELFNEATQFKNSSFNFGPDSSINKNVGELIEAMMLKWPKSPGWEHIKILGEMKKESGLLKLTCDKANIQLNWYPVLSFEETIEYTVEWYLNFNQKEKSIFEYTNNQIKQYTETAKLRNLKWAI